MTLVSAAFSLPDVPMLEILTLALDLTSSPVALFGYIGLGVYATTPWRAFKYAVLWGFAIQIFALSLGRADFFDLQGLAVQTGLRLIGALIVTMGVFYLYRVLRGRTGGSGRGGSGPADNGPAPRRKPPHLRRVK